ncbi:DUF4304 domain-containing protein [Massilia pinisoli]|uniref:DUF4304 domain-containing protein n=1 Tax=Massilia pinisoli TaxID=1772194 RepID=A0ABT1ZTT9_9BURK|nr:DUF4304 domain-containing protein [Massilia pinisoli]MCS0583322.1 DUF4304 domain-containing protein [Massilia pinisoli]
MKEILQYLGAHIRTLGFKGSGQTFRKVEDDYVFVINVQASRSGDVFYVNLGAQPTFIPAECDAALSTLKEYECVMRRRVGEEWNWDLNDEARLALIGQLEAEQKAFFGTVRELRTAMAQDSVDELLRKYSVGKLPARAALHLARAAAFLGHSAMSHALVERGLTLAGPHATGLIHDLQTVGQALHSD